MNKQQAENIKKQLISQLEKSDIENKEEIEEAIKIMNPEQLEEFLKQNKLIKDEPGHCIFCSIVENKTASYKIDEDKEAIAVLEINPVSEGHSLIIPKIHSEKIPDSVLSFAKKVAEKIKVLKPKKIDITTSTVFGHGIINILPVYENETINSERKKADEKELKELQNKLTSTKTKEKIEKPKQVKREIISDKTHWLPKRIP